MTRARKLAIIEQAEPVSDIASEIASAVKALAGSICWLAAEASDEDLTLGELRQRAALYYRTAELGFGGVKYDGEPITEMCIEQCDRLLAKVKKAKR